MDSATSLRASQLGDGFVELCFDRADAPINKFDARTVNALREAVAALATQAGLRGVLVTSAKDVFIVGADITEFGEMFRLPHAELVADVRHSNEVFLALEDLGVPSVVAINGFALGGGLECALACSLRAMSRTARIGLPEVKLGLIPGFGGTVRLARLAGTRTAIEWVTDGRPRDADAALAAGVVDAVFEPEALREGALALLRRAADGQVDWRAAQERKRGPVRTKTARDTPGFQAWRDPLVAGLSPHLPAALSAVQLLERTEALDRDAALALEAETFARISQTQAAGALVQAFLGDQSMRKAARRLARDAAPLQRVVVLGPFEPRLAAAAAKAGIAFTHAGSDPRHGDIAAADLVAVFEDLAPEALATLEARLCDDAVLVLELTDAPLGERIASLRRPERGVGLRLVHPVATSELVEVIRGAASSPGAVAAAVAFVLALRQLPLVVGDAPGQLIARLTHTLTAASRTLAEEGIAVERVAKVMRDFGWSSPWPTVVAPAPTHASTALSDAQIVERLMLPLVTDATRALGEGLVPGAAELDLAAVLAAGCPVHTGGPLKWADWTGLAEVVRRCDALRAHGPLYEAPPRLRILASENGAFHGA